MLAVARLIWRLSADLALIAVATVAALVLRENISLEPAKLIDLAPYLGFSLVAAVVTGFAFGLDRALWRYAALSDFLRVIAVVALTTFAATIAMFVLNRMEGVSRSIPVLQMLIATCLMVGGRIVVRGWLQSEMHAQSAAMLAGHGRRPADDALLIVGVNTQTWLLLRTLHDFDRHAVRVAGIFDPGSDGGSRAMMRGHPIYGPETDLVSLIRMLSVHGLRVTRIIVTVPDGKLPASTREALAELGATAKIRVESLIELLALDARAAPAATADAQDDSVDRSLVASVPSIVSTVGGGAVPPATDAESALRFDGTVLAPRAARSYLRVKRAADAAMAAILLVLLLPVIGLVALAVALAVGRPVIFWQDRTGLGGRRFHLLKFRTMTDAFDASGRKLTDAERVNGVCRFLRATRLDELPQLWNILVGEMSFVGPRPLLVADQIDGAMVRHMVRPGLTGWAQVKGGRAIGAVDKMALDVWYVQNASLWLDVKIVMLTVPMILFGERVSSEAVTRAWSDLRLSGVCPPEQGPAS